MRIAKFTKSLTLGLEPQIYDTIKAITDKQQISAAEFIRNILNATLLDNDNVATSDDNQGGKTDD